MKNLYQTYLSLCPQQAIQIVRNNAREIEHPPAYKPSQVIQEVTCPRNYTHQKVKLTNKTKGILVFNRDNRFHKGWEVSEEKSKLLWLMHLDSAGLLKHEE